MRRLFFSLYLSIAAALVLFLLAVPFLVERGFPGLLLAAVSEYADAPRELFEAEFTSLPQAQWQAHMTELKKEFGYEVALLDIKEIVEDKAVLKRLRNGEVSVSLDDEQDYTYLPLRGSDYIVKVYFSQRESEHGERQLRGFYYLLEKQLAPLSVEEREAYFRDLNARISFPFAQIPLAELNLTQEEHATLNSGRIVSHDVDGPQETYFKRMVGTDRALVIGPIHDPFIGRHANSIALTILGLLFGVAVFLWLRPLWRDMLALDHGAAAFGVGQLEMRVAVAKRSPIRELAATFNAMATRIKALINAQKELTDSVSHELRTPITRLRFGMDRLENCSNEDDRLRFMQGMRKDVDELDQLVDELLTYSRLSNTDPTLAARPVELAPWLTQIVRDHRILSGDIEILSQLDPQLGQLTFDARLMSRALSNLIRNAVRHARSTVKVTVTPSSNGTQIMVEDDGPGIAEEYRESIFEPFARLEASRNRESGGYGLGLAIVKRICDWHGAAVSVDSSSLGGARIVIDFAEAA